MTQKETIQNLKAYLDGDMAIGNIIPLRSVLESAIKYLEPSLPSNLDGAANTFNREDAARMWDYEGKTEDEIVEAAFKAGAEWMAEQGVSMQITDDTEWEEVDFFIHKNVDGGSIIQIRKK